MQVKDPRLLRWHRAVLRLCAAVLAGAVLAAGVATWLTHAPLIAPPAAARIPLADETAILASPLADPAVFRFAENPDIVVLRFGTQEAQGRALDRVAAFVEQGGLPRDRVLDDAAMAAADAAFFLFAHDYRATDLLHFFAVAARDGVALNPAEIALRALLPRLGWHGSEAGGALVSIAGAPPEVPREQLAMALRHELSHGEFFTRPAYAAHVRRFWAEALSAGERTAMRARFAALGYDAENEELMANEMQAYLAHTPGQDGTGLGLAPARAGALRAAFVAGMPPGWLRDLARTRQSLPAEQDPRR